MIPGSERFSGEGNGNPFRVFLPGGSLAGCSPWGCKESDTTEQLTHTVRFSSLSYVFWVLSHLCLLSRSLAHFFVLFLLSLTLESLFFIKIHLYEFYENKTKQNSEYVLFCLIMCITDTVFSVACLLQNSFSCVFWKTEVPSFTLDYG